MAQLLVQRFYNPTTSNVLIPKSGLIIANKSSFSILQGDRWPHFLWIETAKISVQHDESQDSDPTNNHHINFLYESFQLIYYIYINNIIKRQEPIS